MHLQSFAFLDEKFANAKCEFAIVPKLSEFKYSKKKSM